MAQLYKHRHGVHVLRKLNDNLDVSARAVTTMNARICGSNVLRDDFHVRLDHRNGEAATSRRRATTSHGLVRPSEPVCLGEKR